MPDSNKRNLLYFESLSMKSLYEEMAAWQGKNEKRLQSVSIQKDGERFCCIALTNPSEVLICDGSTYTGYFATVTENGHLCVETC